MKVDWMKALGCWSSLLASLLAGQEPTPGSEPPSPQPNQVTAPPTPSELPPPLPSNVITEPMRASTTPPLVLPNLPLVSPPCVMQPPAVRPRYHLPSYPRTWILRVFEPLEGDTEQRALGRDVESVLQKFNTDLGGTAPLPANPPLDCSATASDARSQVMTSTQFPFHEPAHFPLIQFGQDGEAQPEDGLTIEEGMRLDLFEDGRYLVYFQATAPALPVTVRLRFVAVTDQGPRQITIPPIRIAPDSDLADHNHPKRWRVVHFGVNGTGWVGVNPRDVKRFGTARFGSLPTETGGFGR